MTAHDFNQLVELDRPGGQGVSDTNPKSENNHGVFVEQKAPVEMSKNVAAQSPGRTRAPPDVTGRVQERALKSWENP
jgi:hypothetical protein